MYQLIQLPFLFGNDTITNSVRKQRNWARWLLYRIKEAGLLEKAVSFLKVNPFPCRVEDRDTPSPPPLSWKKSPR